jgi:hypothetical protein
MPRPSKLNAEEEKELKFWLLFAIKEMECKNTTEIAEFELSLKPHQVQYYLNKFNLTFKYPYAFDEDLIDYESWYDANEANGTWLGEKTTLKAIIEREADIKGDKDLIYAPNPPMHGKFYSYKAMIEAAKSDPSIKTVGDWERKIKVSSNGVSLD